MILLNICGLQIWLCLFTFQLITSKQLNSLTTIDTLSWLGGAVVTHPLWVLKRSWVQYLALARVFMFDFLCSCCCVFTFLSKNTLFVTKFCNFFCNVNLLSILIMLQDLSPIIRIYYRYIPSICTKINKCVIKFW